MAKLIVYDPKEKVGYDARNFVVYVGPYSNIIDRCSKCVRCNMVMPICWDIICCRCFQTFCYDCADHYRVQLEKKWYCKSCSKERYYEILLKNHTKEWQQLNQKENKKCFTKSQS